MANADGSTRCTDGSLANRLQKTVGGAYDHIATVRRAVVEVV